MSFLPAFDAALTDLVKTLHDPTKHKISGNECELLGTATGAQLNARLYRIERIFRNEPLQSPKSQE